MEQWWRMLTFIQYVKDLFFEFVAPLWEWFNTPIIFGAFDTGVAPIHLMFSTMLTVFLFKTIVRIFA